MNAENVKEAKTVTGALLALGAIMAGVRSNPHPDGRAFVILPQADGSAKVDYLDRPNAPVRATGLVVANDVASFCEYVNRHRDAHATVVYASLTPAGFICVLNDHTKSAAGWRDHRVNFGLEHSMELANWMEHDRASKDQRTFIEFIEEQLHDFVNPTGAKMYEIATNFKAKSGASFKSAINQANGSVQFEYIETVEGGAGVAGRISVPEEFTIKVPVWSGLGQRMYEFKARLRYKLSGGTISFHYALDRPKKVIETAFGDTLEKIKKDVKDCLVIFGSPGGK